VRYLRRARSSLPELSEQGLRTLDANWCGKRLHFTPSP
jgi:hypothetical protein